jgi:hypothetical protein
MTTVRTNSPNSSTQHRTDLNSMRGIGCLLHAKKNRGDVFNYIPDWNRE